MKAKDSDMWPCSHAFAGSRLAIIMGAEQPVKFGKPHPVRGSRLYESCMKLRPPTSIQSPPKDVRLQHADGVRVAVPFAKHCTYTSYTQKT